MRFQPKHTFYLPNFMCYDLFVIQRTTGIGFSMIQSLKNENVSKTPFP